MRELLKICSTIDRDEIDAVAQVTVEIVRHCLRRPRRQRLARDAREGSLVDRVKAYFGVMDLPMERAVRGRSRAAMAFRRLRFHSPQQISNRDAAQPGLAQWLRALGRT